MVKDSHGVLPAASNCSMHKLMASINNLRKMLSTLYLTSHKGQAPKATMHDAENDKDDIDSRYDKVTNKLHLSHGQSDRRNHEERGNPMIGTLIIDDNNREKCSKWTQKKKVSVLCSTLAGVHQPR